MSFFRRPGSVDDNGDDKLTAAWLEEELDVLGAEPGFAGEEDPALQGDVSDVATMILWGHHRRTMPPPPTRPDEHPAVHPSSTPVTPTGSPWPSTRQYVPVTPPGPPRQPIPVRPAHHAPGAAGASGAGGAGADAGGGGDEPAAPRRASLSQAQREIMIRQQFTFRRGYRDGWVECMRALAVLTQAQNFELAGAMRWLWEWQQTALTGWQTEKLDEDIPAPSVEDTLTDSRHRPQHSRSAGGGGGGGGRSAR